MEYKMAEKATKKSKKRNFKSRIQSYRTDAAVDFAAVGNVRRSADDPEGLCGLCIWHNSGDTGLCDRIYYE